ncbi:MAG: hypothetical protein ACI4PF_02395 [Christensenellales bacterium]
MWVAFIITSVVGLGAIALTYALYGCNQVDFSCKKMSQSEFRYKVLNEELDCAYPYCTRFQSPISEEGQKKYDNYCNKIHKKSIMKTIFFWALPVLIFAIVLFGFSYIGAFLDREQLNKEIASYQASKYTIEISLENDDLTGLERVELVKQASEKNEWLARKQYEVQQWYRFYLNKNAVLELKPIDLTKGKV